MEIRRNCGKAGHLYWRGATTLAALATCFALLSTYGFIPEHISSVTPPARVLSESDVEHPMLKPEKEFKRCWLDTEGQQRCQANVFLFGVSKCGTTTMSTWLAHHRDMRLVGKENSLPDLQESHVLDANMKPTFWSEVQAVPIGPYAVKMPRASVMDSVMDYTPHYSIVASVPYRILRMYGRSAFNGTTKYIVMLREPVARTISSWEFRVKPAGVKVESKHEKMPNETRTLEAVVREGQDSVNKLIRCIEAEGPVLPSDLRARFDLDLHRCPVDRYLQDGKSLYKAHVGKSMYAMQLERWFYLFGSENIKVVFLEEMHEDPVGTLESVLNFIGLEMDAPTGTKGLKSRAYWEDIVSFDSNEASEEKKQILKQQVTPEILQSLRDFFAPHNAHLEKLLGRPVPTKWSTSSV